MGEGQNTSERKRTGFLSWLKPSGKEARKQQKEEGTKRHRQAMLAHTIDTATLPIKTKSPFPTSKRVAMGPRLPQESPQSVSQKDTASQKTPVQRFRDITKNPPEPTIEPIYHPVPETVQDSPQPTNEPTVSSPPEGVAAQSTETNLPKKKGRKLDPVAARESLKKAGWRKKTSPPVQPEYNTSIPPFKRGDYASIDKGLDKWQPGEGAIKGKVLKEVWEQSKEIPEYPSSRSEPKVEKSKSTLTPQKKVKVPA